MYSKVALGGTFDILHVGHRKLISHALRISKRLHLGITSDAFVGRIKNYKCASFETRKRNIAKFLGSRISRVELYELDDEYGIAQTRKDLEAIVVSDETKARAEAINKARVSGGLKPLEIISLPIIYADDLKKISCERIRSGAIDANGRRLRPVAICVGSKNRSKLVGVGKTAKRIFGRVAVKGVRIDAIVPFQPFGQETIEGATYRALEAKRRTECDYGVGVESGIFDFGGRYFDCTWCAVYDGSEVTLGSSMCFEIEGGIIDKIKKEGETLGSVFSKKSGVKDIGEKGGAISYLSKGMAKRSELNEQAFLTAMIPRISRAKG